MPFQRLIHVPRTPPLRIVHVPRTPPLRIVLPIPLINSVNYRRRKTSNRVYEKYVKTFDTFWLCLRYIQNFRAFVRQFVIAFVFDWCVIHESYLSRSLVSFFDG